MEQVWTDQAPRIPSSKGTGVSSRVSALCEPCFHKWRTAGGPQSSVLQQAGTTTNRN